jgi:hypothetical protein
MQCKGIGLPAKTTHHPEHTEISKKTGADITTEVIEVDEPGIKVLL